MTNREENDKKRFILFMVLAVVVGVLYLLWGQSNSAATLYDLGFLRYKAEAQLNNVESWKRTEAEQTAYESAAVEGATWAAAHKCETGSYQTVTAAQRLGNAEGVLLTLEYSYYRQDNAAGTVILLHEFCGTTEEAQIWAPYWWEQGYSVLIPVQRGYTDAGDVNYTPTTYGVYEEFDLYDLIHALGLAEERVLIHGKGAAAAAAILLCANMEDAGVDGLVCETVYDNLGTLQRDMVKDLFNLNDTFVGRFLRTKIRNRVGFDADSVDISTAAANMKTPVLFLDGVEESFLGGERTLRVYTSCAAPKMKASLLGSYRGLWLTDGELYRSSISEFLEVLNG